MGYPSSLQLRIHSVPIFFNTCFICKVSDIPFFRELKSDISHALFCEVKLIRGNNKYNSLHETQYILNTVLGCQSSPCGHSPENAGLCQRPPGKQSSQDFFLWWKEFHPWPFTIIVLLRHDKNPSLLDIDTRSLLSSYCQNGKTS